MPRFCAAYGCVNSSGKIDCQQKKISYHRFPLKDSDRLKEWLAKLMRDNFVPNQHSVLCSEHFSDKDFESAPFSKRRTLKADAVPSKFYFSKARRKRKKTSYQFPNTEYISCSVPGCKSKYFSKTKDFIVSEENVLVFPVPHADEQFNKWKETFKQANIELTRDDHICEKHFLENDIERYSKTEILKGNIEIRKKISSLKCDAIPVKFLKPPFHITKDSSIKPPVFQNDMIKSKNSITDQLNLNSSAQRVNTIPVEIKIPDNLPVKSSADSSVNLTQCQTSIKKECKECMPYEEIVKSIQLVKKPTTYWSILCTDEFILFAKWNNKFIAEKRLVIERSLTIRVFLKEWEIEMTDLVDITSIDDVSSLLEKVENYKIDLTR